MESISISVNDNLSIEDINKHLNRLCSKIMTSAFAKKNLTNQKILTLIISLSAGISLLSGLFLLSISPIVIGVLGAISTGAIVHYHLESTKVYKNIITANKIVIVNDTPVEVEKARNTLLKLYDSKQKEQLYGKRPQDNKKTQDNKKPNQTSYDIACSDIGDLIDLETGISHKMRPRMNSEYFD